MKVVQVMLLGMIAALLTSCSSVTVIADTNSETDFSRYKTFSFLGWQAESGQLLDEEDKEILYGAFEKEFNARGLTYVERGGDMDVSLFIVFNEETGVSAYNRYTGTAHGAYDLYDTGWAYGYGNTKYSQRAYRVGTLVLDAFDGKTKKQIWQGTVQSKVNEDRPSRARTIPKKVGLLMKKFPKSR